MINNKLGIKISACVLSAVLVAGTAGGAYAMSIPAGRDYTLLSVKNVKADVNNSSADSASGKEETVYILSNADGSVKKIIVSNWLKNSSGSRSISDYTELKDVVNVKGDEEFKAGSDGRYVWEAAGNDIYYQGTIEKELPVDLTIKYILDGKEVSAGELAGKSGRLTMRFEYTNNEKRTVKINGEDTEIYVPFAVLTGMILNNDVFKNVEVSNGKLINDGDKSVVAGFALPGMQESLGLDADKLEIPDYFEVTAEVENFELTTTLTVATNEIFGGIELDEDADLDDITDAIHELSDAVDKLLNGSEALYDGISTLYDKSGELVSGVDKLADGSKSLADGANRLNAGSSSLASGADTLNAGSSELAAGADSASAGSSDLLAGANRLNAGSGDLLAGVNRLYAGSGDLLAGVNSLNDGSSSLAAGADTLNAGLSQLAGNNDTLVNGARTVFESLLSMADSQLEAAGLSVPKLTIDNYAQVLDGVLASLDETAVRNLAYNTALEKVTAAVHAQDAQIKAQVEAAYRKQILEAVLSSAGHPMTAEQYAQACASGLIDAAEQGTIEQAVEAQLQSADIQAAINAAAASKTEELINQNMQSGEVQAQIEAAAASAKNGQGSIASLKAQLDSYNEFYKGLSAYTAGVSQACAGSSELAAAAHTLNDGAGKLAAGANTLNDGAVQLAAGIKTLSGGSSELAAGANTLNDGLSKLAAGTRGLNSGAGEFAAGAHALNNGAGELAAGTKTLYEGAGALKDGSDALIDGVKQLKDGALELSDGMKQFKEEGIQKIVDAFDGDLSDLVSRFRAVADASKEYNSFAGIEDGTDGSVKFIYRTASIEALDSEEGTETEE